MAGAPLDDASIVNFDIASSSDEPEGWQRVVHRVRDFHETQVNPWAHWAYEQVRDCYSRPGKQRTRQKPREDTEVEVAAAAGHENYVAIPQGDFWRPFSCRALVTTPAQLAPEQISKDFGIVCATGSMKCDDNDACHAAIGRLGAVRYFAAFCGNEAVGQIAVKVAPAAVKRRLTDPTGCLDVSLVALEAALMGSIHEVNQLLRSENGSPARTKGAAGVVGVMSPHNSRLLVANVGDVRVVIGVPQSEEEGGGVRALEVTRLHSVVDPFEKQRLEESSCIFHGKEPDSVYECPGTDISAAFLTRGVGFFDAHNFGFAVAPDLADVILTKGERDFIICASRNVWDVMSAEEVVQFVARCLQVDCSFQECAVRLWRLARDEWKVHKDTAFRECVVIVLPTV